MIKKTPNSLTKMLLVANGLLWVVFWSIFFGISHKATPHWPPTDGAVMVAGRTCDLLSPISPDHWFAYMAFWPSAPTWVVIRPVFKQILDFYHFGTNLSGTRLIVVCVASFLQWYLIAFVMKRLLARGADKQQPSV
jgi:hypothetical protein